MRIQKIVSCFLLLLFFVPAAAFGLTGSWDALSWPKGEDLLDGSAAGQIEESLVAAFPGRDWLCGGTAALQTALGQNQYNNCFYSENGIIRNLPDADEQITAQNLQALQQYAAGTLSPCYFLLCPTAAAIEQNQIPSLALELLFNQKQYIQRCYSSLSSLVYTIDGYNSLFSHQSEYLFYRADSRLTALGCYHLYVSAGAKLGYSARSMDYFSISHPVHDFVGNVASLVPYVSVQPDLISLFHYQKHNWTIWLQPDPGTNEEKIRLYDLSQLESDDPLRVYLGPDCGVTDLLIPDTPYDGTLLVFTDGSCDALFPLMALHYQQVRVVDLNTATPAQLSQIDPDCFDQVLFAFSVEHFGYDSFVSDALGAGPLS